jgi:hypothetical protein
MKVRYRQPIRWSMCSFAALVDDGVAHRCGCGANINPPSTLCRPKSLTVRLPHNTAPPSHGPDCAPLPSPIRGRYFLGCLPRKSVVGCRKPQRRPPNGGPVCAGSQPAPVCWGINDGVRLDPVAPCGPFPDSPDLPPPVQLVAAPFWPQEKIRWLSVERAGVLSSPG